MGFWDIFKKETKTEKKIAKPKNRWTILGPAYLDGLTIEHSSQCELKHFEWDGQLKTSLGQTEFKVKFYGQLHENHKNLIVGTDSSPALIYALDTSTQKEILIFDGCRHGYNAIFCDEYSPEIIKNRKTESFYTDSNGNDIFKIIISAYYQIDYDSENEDFIENVDENGLIELNDGSKVEFETVKRNGFDVLQISVIANNGKTTEILSEELS
jgi:hypothetical protein